MLSHQPFESETSKHFSSRVMTGSSQRRVTRTIESLQLISLQAQDTVNTNEISKFYSDFFTIKLHSRCCRTAPDKLQNGAHSCFSNLDSK